MRPFRNAGVLFIGRGVQGVLSVVYLALAARGLGVEAFGTLILIHSLVLSTAQLCRFQTWQAIMKYGADAQQREDQCFFRRLIVFSLRLDFFSATVACGILIAGMPSFLSLFELPVDMLGVLRSYAILVLFMVAGSGPLGVLRLFDRHDLIAWQTVIEPSIRLLGVVLLFAFDASLLAYLVVWFAATVASEIATWVMALGVLKVRRLIPRREDLCITRFDLPPGIWRFVLGTNLNSTLNLGNTQLGILLCGWLLGASGAGYYRIAKQFADVLVKSSSKLLVPAIYTDMAELTARDDHRTRRQVVRRSVLVAGAAAVAVFAVLTVSGRFLISLTVGEAYLPAYVPMLWLALAGVIAILSFPFEPLLVSAGRIRATVITRLAAIVIYFAAFYTLGTRFELLGAALAATVNAAVTTLLFYYYGSSLLRKQHAGSGTSAG